MESELWEVNVKWPDGVEIKFSSVQPFRDVTGFSVHEAIVFMATVRATRSNLLFVLFRWLLMSLLVSRVRVIMWCGIPWNLHFDSWFSLCLSISLCVCYQSNDLFTFLKWHSLVNFPAFSAWFSVWVRWAEQADDNERQENSIWLCWQWTIGALQSSINSICAVLDYHLKF